MQKNLNKHSVVSIMLWFSVIVWMAVIFLFSAQPGDASSDLSNNFIRFLVGLFVDDFEAFDAFAQENVIQNFSYPIRKLAHFSEYFILGVLIFSAISSHRKSNIFVALISIGTSFIYAAGDELHQLFVPNRACRFTDILIDTFGAVAGVTVCILIIATAKKRTT